MGEGKGMGKGVIGIGKGEEVIGIGKGEGADWDKERGRMMKCGQRRRSRGEFGYVRGRGENRKRREPFTISSR